jgi:hypothetical protein
VPEQEWIATLLKALWGEKYVTMHQNRDLRLLVPSQNLDPDVLMMEPAEHRYRCDAAGLLLPSKIWSVFIQ